MINDSTVNGDFNGNYLSPEDFIEKYKDSVVRDSNLMMIRKFPLAYGNQHGGTFDIYQGEMEIGKFKRIHEYGSSMERSSFNEDKYYLEGKLISWIKVDYLELDSPIRNGVKIHIYDVPVE